MQLRKTMWVVSFLFACASIHSQVVGSAFEGLAPEGWTKTAARSFDEYRGRLLLVEFFAYW